MSLAPPCLCMHDRVSLPSLLATKQSITAPLSSIRFCPPLARYRGEVVEAMNGMANAVDTPSNRA